MLYLQRSVNTYCLNISFRPCASRDTSLFMKYDTEKTPRKTDEISLPKKKRRHSSCFSTFLIHVNAFAIITRDFNELKGKGESKKIKSNSKINCCFQKTKKWELPNSVTDSANTEGATMVSKNFYHTINNLHNTLEMKQKQKNFKTE